MAKYDSRTNELLEPMKSLSAMFATNPALRPQAQHFWQAQDRMLAEAEKFSSAWFKRRQEAAQSAMRASQEIASNGTTDPAAAMKTIADWQAHSMERIAEDTKDCMEMMTRCAGAAATNEAEALEEAATKANKSTKTSKSSPV